MQMNLVLVDRPKPRTFETGDVYRHDAQSKIYDVPSSFSEIKEWHDPEFVSAMWDWVDQRFPGCDTIALGVTIMFFEAPKKSWPSASGSFDKPREFFVNIDVPMGAIDLDIWSVEWEVLRAVSAQATLDLMAKRLELSGPVPQVPLTRAQLDWIEANGRPSIKVSMGKWQHFDWREEAAKAKGDPGAFDAWQLFPGGQDKPLAEAKRRWRKIPKRQRVDAQAAVAQLIDEYFDVVEAGCVSDGLAMEAAALLLLGRDAWQRVIAEPDGLASVLDEFDVDPADGELLLDLINWWEL